jgi:hypothetical protein
MQPIPWTEWPTSALVGAGSLWPFVEVKNCPNVIKLVLRIHKFYFRKKFKKPIYFINHNSFSFFEKKIQIITYKIASYL